MEIIMLGLAFIIVIGIMFIIISGEQRHFMNLTKMAMWEYEEEKEKEAELYAINAELDELEKELNNHKP